MRDRRLLSLCLFVSFHLATSLGGARGAQVDAVVGEPFGVAEITLPFPVEDRELPLARAGVTVESTTGRTHYPAVTSGFRRRLLGGGQWAGSHLTVMFLFRGHEPFDVTIGTPTRQTLTVTPERASSRAHQRLLERWWRGYNELFRDLAEESEHPPLVETYLTSMLARRFGMAESLEARLASDSRDHKGRQTLDLLAGAGEVRMQIIRATSLGLLPESSAADLPLPAAVAWRPVVLPDFPTDVDIEPMAMRVPEECFYVRFGQYSNFFWLNTLLEDYGGEIGNMISARGYRTSLSQRIQDQLAMKQNALAELLGPQAIADVAAIGMDTFTRDGAAVGAIFEARNSLLGIDLLRQRQESLFREKERGASLNTVTIGGREVSFLSTPDNRLRSYYLVDGKYHLVTNSRAIVERFLEVAGGKGSLGANEEFRYARSVVPTHREDTIFIYFSSAFFRHLLSPAYQVELHRRLQAATDIELMTLAGLAAKAEGLPCERIEDLVSADVLPRNFGLRPDASRPVVAGHHIVDSLRGERGYFTPVPDVRVDQISAGERQRYLQQAAYYADNWRQADPLLIALKRFALDEDRGERITFDAFITPMDDFKYQVLMSMLGQPSSHKLVPPEGNVISIDAEVRGGILFPSIPPHRIFLCVQDHEPLATSGPENVLKLLQIARTTPGFLGGWPKPGFLDLLPFVTRAIDEEGFSELPLGVLRWQGRGFSVLSLDKGLLTQVRQQLGFVEEDRPAQVRVHIGDLSQARFGDWLNQLGYERARQVSVTNARLMGILSQQLKVPLSESRSVAEHLVDAQLICALGGDYEIVSHQDEEIWQSSAWPASLDYQLPADYVTPPLDWLRGLEGQLVKYPDRLVVHGYMDMQRKEREPAIKLPFFDLLNGKKPQNQDNPKGDQNDTATKKDY